MTKKTTIDIEFQDHAAGCAVVLVQRSWGSRSDLGLTPQAYMIPAPIRGLLRVEQQSGLGLVPQAL